MAPQELSNGTSSWQLSTRACRVDLYIRVQTKLDLGETDGLKFQQIDSGWQTHEHRSPRLFCLQIRRFAPPTPTDVFQAERRRSEKERLKASCVVVGGF